MVEIVVDDSCTLCCECVEICSNNILSVEDFKVVIGDSSKCTLCETCVDVCLSEAIKVKG